MLFSELLLQVALKNCKLVVQLSGNTVANLLVERLDVLNVLKPALGVNGATGPSTTTSSVASCIVNSPEYPSKYFSLSVTSSPVLQYV